MKQLVKAKYEAPSTDVLEMSMERNLLQASGVEATRDSYGTATTEDWGQ